MTEELEQYLNAHIDAEPELLRRLTRDTYVNILRPRMLSGHLQGRILKMLCRMIRPMRVMELGTYTGYSALCFAEGLPDGGKITTLDANDEIEAFTRRYLDESEHRDKIEYLISDALTYIRGLQPDEMFDLVFLDADKREYVAYFEAILPHVKAGGFILADNTLWDEKILLPPSHRKDEQTEGIRQFNDLVAHDNRVETVILPLRDGLTLLMKK